MILFLDAISSLPEFSLIEDNKLVYSKEILNNHDEKMSDCIISSYIQLEKKFSLSNKLKFLIVNTGPGSYTALRIGIAFISGLSLSKKIKLQGISCVDLFRFEIKKHQMISTGIYINSSNNQKFFCLYDLKNKNYKIHKIEKNFKSIKFDTLYLKRIVTNSDLPISELCFLKDIKYKKVSFKELVFKNLQKILDIPDQDIIEPIYISNNKILN